MDKIKKLTDPHDRFFRTFMRDVRVAKEFITQALPEALLKHIDLSDIKLQDGTFVDRELTKSAVDILYSVRLNNNSPAYIYLLIEHQRNPEKLMPFRMIQYALKIMEQHIKQTEKSILPVIIPIVLYNGKNCYPYSTDFFSLFGDQETFARSIMFKPFHLMDLTEIPDEKMREQQWSGVMTFALKHIDMQNTRALLSALAPYLKRLHATEEFFLGDAVLFYLLKTRDFKSLEQFAKMLNEKISIELGDRAMSLAERLEARGIKKGRLEGRVEGEALAKRELITKMIKNGADLVFIAKLTELRLEEVKAIASALTADVV